MCRTVTGYPRDQLREMGREGDTEVLLPRVLEDAIRSEDLRVEHLVKGVRYPTPEGILRRSSRDRPQRNINRNAYLARFFVSGRGDSSPPRSGHFAGNVF